MRLDVLRKIGISDGEISVYSALLELGLTTINEIHEKTGIERRNIYDILNKLVGRGLVSYIRENKKRYFQIAHPSRIVGYIEEKKHGLEIVKKEIEKELPSIINKFESEKYEINAEIYRGPEGIKTVWEDMLNYDTIMWIGSGRYVPKKLPHFFASWNKRRIKRRIKILNLLRYEFKKEITPFKLEHVKFLPKEFSVNPIAIGIYGNKVVNFLLGEMFFAFVIESKELAENYKSYFRYLWAKVAD